MKRNLFVSGMLAMALVFGFLWTGCLSSETRTSLKMIEEMSDVDTPMRTWNEAKSASPTILEGTWLNNDENTPIKWTFVGTSYLQTGEVLDTPANREEFARQGVPFTPATVLAYGTIEVTDLTLKLIGLVVDQLGRRTAVPESVRPRLEYDYSIDGDELTVFQDGQFFRSFIKQ